MYSLHLLAASHCWTGMLEFLYSHIELLWVWCCIIFSTCTHIYLKWESVWSEWVCQSWLVSVITCFQLLFSIAPKIACSDIVLLCFYHCSVITHWCVNQFSAENTNWISEDSSMKSTVFWDVTLSGRLITTFLQNINKITSQPRRQRFINTAMGTSNLRKVVM
jgi:hypothetical protein